MKTQESRVSPIGIPQEHSLVGGLFWFIKSPRTAEVPSPIELMSETPFAYGGVEDLQKMASEFVIQTGENGDSIRLTMTTERADISQSLNGDAILFCPLGRRRILLGVLDGVKSRKSISGLEPLDARGAFFISHLIALGFPTSESCRNLAAEESLSAGDVMRKINNWLYQELKKVTGVNYEDVLTVPGVAATITLIDLPQNQISIAHVADTMAIAEFCDGSLEILTPNQNERFDRETLNLAQAITRNEDISLRQAARDERIRAQSAQSFQEKINTREGCGILNGMPELVTYGLIVEEQLPITSDLKSLHLASDGAIGPWLGQEGLDQERAIKQFLEAAKPNPLAVIKEGRRLLQSDPDFFQIPRLKDRDDATYVQVTFSPIIDSYQPTQIISLN